MTSRHYKKDQGYKDGNNYFYTVENVEHLFVLEGLLNTTLFY